MNSIREIVTKTIVGKGKKLIRLTDTVPANNTVYSILGCWIINHNFDATLNDSIVNVNGTYEVNIWYAYDNNTKTDIAKKIGSYNQNIKIRKIVDDINSDCRDIIVRALQQPTVVNAQICDANDTNNINIEILLELLAEVIGETKIKVNVLEQYDPCGQYDDPYEEEDFENQINEDFINPEVN